VLDDSKSNNPIFIDHRKNKIDAIHRLKDFFDKRREIRTKSILAQEGESLRLTIGRVFYLSFCILFDILILPEILFYFDKSVFAWFIFGVILTFFIYIQKNFYEKNFTTDFREINFNQ
tara:strand:+ start:3293 stop:3646 length:354 start_codon:yes stop_codon:yes gene_type:complete